MKRKAVAGGLLGAGDTVVEYTGGSTRPALALVCRAKGYRALNMVARAAELSARPGHHAADQFNTVRHPRPPRPARARAMGTDRRSSDGVLPGHGTGASLTGVSDTLKPRGVFIQAHEPASSPAITAGGSGPFLIQGWTGLVTAIAMTARLAREDGIFAGISTGANVVGAHRLAERLGPDAVIVTIAVDSGFKYLSVDHGRSRSSAGG